MPVTIRSSLKVILCNPFCICLRCSGEVPCKVGAANWGNSKKEDFSYELNDEYYNTLFEKCWKGYEKKGMKTMFGKRYPNCVKKEETEVAEKLDIDTIKKPVL